MKSYLALEKSRSMSDAQSGHGRPALQPDHEEGPGYEHCGDHGGDDTQDQGNRESLDRPGAELEEEQRGEYGADVGVHDGVHGMLEAFVDRKPHGLAVQ